MYISELLRNPDERRLRLSTQLGVQHVVIDNRGSEGISSPTGVSAWDARKLTSYRKWVEGFGLRMDVFALDVGSILLDSLADIDSARKQRAVLADNIRKAADAGIDCLNYDLQMVGITRTGSRPGRGGTQNPGFAHAEYTADAGRAPSVRTAAPAGGPKEQGGRAIRSVGVAAGWNAIEFLVEGLVPAADAAGVRMACLPQDPPYPAGGLDDIEHVVGSADGMRQFLALSPSRNHGLSFCQGTVAAMFKEPGKAMIPVIEEFAATGRLFLVHFRNIRGGYLDFQNVFPDEGDVDMFQALKAYQRGGYAGPLCPAHMPVSPLDEGGERFMSFALGYTRGLLQAAGIAATAAAS